jgi:hypothetical protein
MKKSIILILSSAAKILLLSLICNLIYDWNNLAKVFGPAISYSQWVGIMAITNCIIPTHTLNQSKNDE